MTEEPAKNRSLFVNPGEEQSAPDRTAEGLVRVLQKALAECYPGVTDPTDPTSRVPGDALSQAALLRPERPAPAEPPAMSATPRFQHKPARPATDTRIPEPAPAPSEPTPAAVAADPVPIATPAQVQAPAPATAPTAPSAAPDAPVITPAATAGEAAPDGTDHARIPVDFVFDDEHPQVALPFTLRIDGKRFDGHSLSVTHLIVSGKDVDDLEPGERLLARLMIHFDGFDLTLMPEVTLREAQSNGSATLRFADPTGPHLPQLRYVINNAISGDLTTLNGLLSYTGPSQPKAPKPAAGPTPLRQRIRSNAIMALSGLAVVAALAGLYTRYTTAQEMHPVFVERAGQQMRATAPGQIGYLNPLATQGEVLFALNANSGDVLNFALPCDCEVAIAPEVAEGTTVLPSDLILTIFRNTSEIQAKTMISVEGLARAMEGDSVFLDLNDGRSIPVDVVVSASTSAAAYGGGLFVPVELRAADGSLSAEDVGKHGRLRITSSVFARFGRD